MIKHRLTRSKSDDALAVNRKKDLKKTRETSVGSLDSFSLRDLMSDIDEHAPAHYLEELDDQTFGVDDSGFDRKIGNEDAFCSLEKKIDKLSDIFAEQMNLISAIKEDVDQAKYTLEKSHNNQYVLLKELLKDALIQRVQLISQDVVSNEAEASDGLNIRAKLLLDAIESKGSYLDRGVRNALLQFLQSNDLKQEIVNTSVTSLQGMVKEQISEKLSSMYAPLLERCHRRLLRHVTYLLDQNFTELEENSSSFCTSIYKTTRSLRRALERHQGLLMHSLHTQKNITEHMRNAIKQMLQKEVRECSKNMSEIFKTRVSDPINEQQFTSVDPMPSSPPQPDNPNASALDQLMKKAVIIKHIQDGKINIAFEKALSASDLSLVVAACHAADPRAVFEPPCSLSQSVLLSLMQQLATDMVHDTQIKCRYLEDAIINLDTNDSAIRTHLPIVVGEIRKYLSQFLAKYSDHAANRQITLIMMAASNLLQ